MVGFLTVSYKLKKEILHNAIHFFWLCHVVSYICIGQTLAKEGTIYYSVQLSVGERNFILRKTSTKRERSSA